MQASSERTAGGSVPIASQTARVAVQLISKHSPLSRTAVLVQAFGRGLLVGGGGGGDGSRVAGVQPESSSVHSRYVQPFFYELLIV